MSMTIAPQTLPIHNCYCFTELIYIKWNESIDVSLHRDHRENFKLPKNPGQHEKGKCDETL